jgi:hypothetical protein
VKLTVSNSCGKQLGEAYRRQQVGERREENFVADGI